MLPSCFLKVLLPVLQVVNLDPEANIAAPNLILYAEIYNGGYYVYEGECGVGLRKREICSSQVAPGAHICVVANPLRNYVLISGMNAPAVGHGGCPWSSNQHLT